MKLPVGAGGLTVPAMWIAGMSGLVAQGMEKWPSVWGQLPLGLAHMEAEHLVAPPIPFWGAVECPSGGHVIAAFVYFTFLFLQFMFYFFVFIPGLYYCFLPRPSTCILWWHVYHYVNLKLKLSYHKRKKKSFFLLYDLLKCLCIQIWFSGENS